MKKILSLIAVLALFAQGMAQNKEIIDMFHSLAQKTGDVKYERQGTIDNYTESYLCAKWLSPSNEFDRQQAEELVSFICPILTRQMPKAKKLYHYEVHDQGVDTVKYTMQFELESRDSSWVYWGATEASPEYLIFKYEIPTDLLFPNFFINYDRKNTIEKKATETLNGNKEAVHNCLASFILSKQSLRPKTYPIRYEFSKELTWEERNNLSLEKMRMEYVYDSVTHVIQTGTHYFIPSDSLNTIKMYKELGDYFLSFMNEREHEWYFFRENLAPIYQLDFDFTVEGSLMEFHTFAKRNPYFILATVDKRGLHILEIISNKDFLYYPDFWKNINNMTDTKIKWNKDFPLSKD
jgi:hypothetical protein